MLAVVAVIGLAAGLGGCSSKAAVRVDRSGRSPAPAFRLDEVRAGRTAVALADYRGKPLVLNFWAAWCDPCEKEMPAFQQVHADVGDRVAFVGIDGQDSRRNATALLRRTGVTYPSGYDPSDRVHTAYRLFGRPNTVFVSPDGKILGRHNGQLTAAELASLLRRFFPAQERGG